MNTIDKAVKVADKYNLLYTIKAIVMAEKELDDHSILQVFARISANKSLIGLGEIYTLFKWGIWGGNNKLTPDELDNIFTETVETIGLDGTLSAVFEAIAKSGLVKLNTRKNP